MSEFVTPIKKNNRLDAVKDTITIPPSPFLNRLGYGTGVSVMELVRSPRGGQLRSPWALKMINRKVKPNVVYSQRLQAEAELLQRMSHPNIVGFRAFSKTKILYLGMEACDVSLGDMIEKRVEEGDETPYTPKQILKNLLPDPEQNQEKNWARSLATLLKDTKCVQNSLINVVVAADISSALDYLHTKMQILHGDIKSYNILVNGDFEVCKLCDFGVTLPLDENGVFDKQNAGIAVYFGTEAWSAPEVVHGGEISHKTDVWPLGLTLWEMLALAPPHAHLNDDDSLQNLDDTQLDDTMIDLFTERYGTRPAVPCGISPRRYGAPLWLFQACTEPPGPRPSAAQLHAAATDMLQHCDEHTHST